MLNESTTNSTVDLNLLENRTAAIDNRIVFHAPGLKRYQTSEYEQHNEIEFVAISVTGEACSLNCEHCKTGVLRGMRDLSSSRESLYETWFQVARSRCKRDSDLRRKRPQG